VRAILANPRYTGRKVWNRQPTSHELVDPANTGLGHRQVQRWALPQGWVISTRPSHPALVSEEDFTAMQGIRADRYTGAASGRRHLLAGLLRPAAGILLGEQPARLPVPPRVLQRHHTGPGPAEEHLRP
jgi:site-specific DNA recombinase